MYQNPRSIVRLLIHAKNNISNESKPHQQETTSETQNNFISITKAKSHFTTEPLICNERLRSDAIRFPVT